MAVLGKDQILSSQDLKTKKVNISEWGGDVIVKCMTGGERSSYDAEVYVGDGDKLELDKKNFRSKLLVRCLVDDKGERLFADEDFELIDKKSSKALDKIFVVARELNGIGVDEEEKLEKN